MNPGSHHSTAASERVSQDLSHTMSAALRATGGQIPEQVRGPSSAPRRAPITHHPAAAALALAAALLLAGCDYLPFGYTQVKEIMAAPAQFEGKEVKLKGRVKSIFKLLGAKSFTLQDETGEITVVTDGQLPAENTEVALKGNVKSAVIVGGASIGLRVEETQRLR